MLHPMQADASFRRYIRIRKGTHSMILMDAPPEKENIEPYIAIARYLHGKGYSAPEILAQDVKAGLLLIEDLGDDSFTQVLKRASGREHELYTAAVDVLAEWHDEARRFFDPQALPLPLYDEALLMREACLFADWYLPQVMGKDKARELRGEYIALWQDILGKAPLASKSWVHRDYHADNLMWLPARSGTQRVGLLDFQDGVYGDAAYDVVSLLEDARRDVAPILAKAMIDRYLAASGADRERFLTAYAILGAQRNCKIIGIFSRLAARDNKHAYLNYLPRVWRYLEHDLAHPALADLRRWIDSHITADQRGVIALRHTSQELALTA
ncbi:MAG: phosphotransferase [Pseudomonadota bacterium]|nr:phosphotransferase [Pseudomonadota bacterium]